MANRTRAQLSVDSSTNFPDNTSQLISPADLRDWITNGIDSFLTQKDASTMQNVIYEAKANTIVAGATTNLATASGNFVHVSGTTQITSFGSCSAGSRFVIVFDDAADILASANLIIPGVTAGNNKIAVPGDCCMIVSETPGQWRIVGYFPAAGAGSGLVVDVTASAPLSSTGGTTPDISIPQADGSTDGYLSATDWTTFNGKGNGTVTSVSGNGTVNGISLSGTVTGSGNITLGGTLSGVDLTSQVTGVLPVANGGSGTATPSLVAGTNVTISGSWPNQTINSSGGGGGGTPGGANGDFQYKNGSSFDGSSLLRLVSGFIVAHTPKIGDSNTTGHFHMHDANSAPTGITNYLTMFWQKASRAIGFRSETDTYESYIQLTAPTADRTYTLPDASGNVVIDSATQTLTNKTLSTPTIDGIATFGNGGSAGEIRLKEGSGGGSEYIALKSPATIGTNYNLVLPATSPGSGQVMISDGSGNLSWSSNPGTTGAKFLSTNPLNTLTGTTAEAFLTELLVPGGTFTTGNSIKVLFRSSRSLVAGVSTWRFYLSDASNVFAGKFAMGNMALPNAANAGSIVVERNLFIGSSTATYYNNDSVARYTDYFGQSFTISNVNWANDQYFIITSQAYSTAVVTTGVGISVSPTG